VRILGISAAVLGLFYGQSTDWIGLAATRESSTGSAEVLDELRRASGSQFCPLSVAAFERMLPRNNRNEAVPERERVLVVS